MRLSDTPLITADTIRKRTAELAKRISRDYAGKELLVIIVLKGGAFFGADLIRRLDLEVTVDFLRAKSYGKTRSTGAVDFLLLPDQPITDRHVLVVEDILDTGLTAQAILAHLAAAGPASVAVCALLDKPARRQTPIKGDYVAITIDNHFVVGYGLDCEERMRHLPDIWIAEEK